MFSPNIANVYLSTIPHVIRWPFCQPTSLSWPNLGLLKLIGNLGAKTLDMWTDMQTHIIDSILNSITHKKKERRGNNFASQSMSLTFIHADGNSYARDINRFNQIFKVLRRKHHDGLKSLKLHAIEGWNSWSTTPTSTHAQAKKHATYITTNVVTSRLKPNTMKDWPNIYTSLWLTSIQAPPSTFRPHSTIINIGMCIASHT